MTGSSPARRLHRFRMKASLLLAVFLSAGTSLPSVDALAYHQGSAEAGKSQSHIEPAGGCQEHAGHCSLARTAPGSGAAVSSAAEVRAEPNSRSTGQRFSTQQVPQFDSGALPQQRAPPAPPA